MVINMRKINEIIVHCTATAEGKDTESDIDRFNDDIWTKAQAEADAQNAMQNQVPKPNNVQQGPILGRDYEEDEVDYDENNFKR